MFILLVFATGRVTLAPLPNGVNVVTSYACCSQGLVFPRKRAKEMVQWYEEKKIGYVDTLTEDYADKHGLTRWALTPSVMQHTGWISSKDFGPEEIMRHGRTAAELVWSFSFEQNDVEVLRQEHESAIHGPT
jgi:hypothetical protein